jgi:glycosyltransferase 2 family protein
VPLPPLADLDSSLHSFFHAAEAFFGNFAAIAWGALALALLMWLGQTLARTRGWFNALRAAYPQTRIRFRRLAAAYLAGAGINAIAPARAGDVVKVVLAKNSIPRSSYPAVASSFLVTTPFDTISGLLVIGFALTQGLLPRPPELPDLPAFEIAFWAEHPRFLIFCLTALAIGFLVAFALLARRVEAFWERVKQGLVIFTDLPRYFRGVAAWQVVSWVLRFGAIMAFLEAFHIGGTIENALLVISVQGISNMLPFTPGGAGAQQALLVATLEGPSAAAVLSYSVGQQIAISAFTAALGFAVLIFVFRRRGWKDLIAEGKKEEAEAKQAQSGAGGEPGLQLTQSG